MTLPTTLSVGGEAPGAGEASFAQHAQEAHGMSPGPARGRGRQAFCKCPPSPGQFKTCLLLGPCLVSVYTAISVFENLPTVWQPFPPLPVLEPCPKHPHPH